MLKQLEHVKKEIKRRGGPGLPKHLQSLFDELSSGERLLILKTPPTEAELTQVKKKKHSWLISVESDPVSEEMLSLYASSTPYGLCLQHSPSLSPKQAQALEKFRGPKLFLDGLNMLTKEQAMMVVRSEFKRLQPLIQRAQQLRQSVDYRTDTAKRPALSLSGLSELPPDVLMILARLPHYELILNGFKSLTPEQASALAHFSGNILELSALKELSALTAKALSMWAGSILRLNGLTSITEESLEALMMWTGSRIDLNGLTEISEEMATRLASSQKLKYLSLNGLKHLSFESAQALARSSVSVIELNHLTSLTPKALHVLLKATKFLQLNSLKSTDELINACRKQPVHCPLVGSRDHLNEEESDTSKMVPLMMIQDQEN